MRERRWLLLTLYGVLLAIAASGALKATRPKFKIATTSTTTPASSTTIEGEEKSHNENNSEGTTTPTSDLNATTGHTLTGIPQIDYIWDPNLPRELNGYNLSDYPFYNTIPTPSEIDFKCDGLHDGFYASVPHKCQVYHHCLYGTRYDFLCANFTAFDQKTFICHFASEVDCANSKKYWHRNDALYQVATSSSTTTQKPTTTSTTTTQAPTVTHEPFRDRDAPRRRRPYPRWRPSYDYYDEEYYDEEIPERGRLYGYDRRVYDDYDDRDRKHRRDRDRERDLPDRNFRDRTEKPARAERDRDHEISPRERFPSMRNSGRRDPMRSGRDPVEEERPRTFEQDQGTRFRVEIEEPEFEDRQQVERARDGEERRFSDGKRTVKDDYDDKENPITAPGNADAMVKPAAPVASVYTRPRMPPKIRRPVPLSEQDRYAYKSSSPAPAAAGKILEPRRRPADLPDADYYDDEFDDVRTRRPPRLRGRPNYRDRDLYEPRERDRPYRTRYRDDPDLGPRKHPERVRDRYYDRERGYARDRALERGTKDRDRDRAPGKPQPDPEKAERSYWAMDRPRMTYNSYEQPRTTEKPREAPTTENFPSEEPPTRSERPQFRSSNPRNEEENAWENRSTVKEVKEQDKFWRPTTQRPHEKEVPKTEAPLDDYLTEYYDEVEEPQRLPPPSPPRTMYRIVKRPFLPSRGGNPNPRGLSPVGVKASAARQDEGKSSIADEDFAVVTTPESRKNYEEKNAEAFKDKSEEEKRIYDAYKVIQSDLQQKNPATAPSIHVSSGGYSGIQDQKPIPNWTVEEATRNDVPSSPGNQKSLDLSGNFKDDGPSGPGNFRAKQRLNEVVTPQRLQDIPESEYDVTLNDALTPTLNQETSLPSGFVLPLHNQPGGSDAVLQPSENDYEYSRPQQGQQQKPFVPSPRFVPPSSSRNERPKTVYYRTPETIHVAATAPQYRQLRGSWHDYSGFQ